MRLFKHNQARIRFVIGIFIVIPVLIFSIFLYKIQIFDGAGTAASVDSDIQTTIKIVTLTAKRGDVLDRNGKLLISSKPSYELLLSHSELASSGDMNEYIRELTYLAAEMGIFPTDTLPITSSAPFVYRFTSGSQEMIRFNRYLDYFKLREKKKTDENDPTKTVDYFSKDENGSLSAPELLVYFKEHYKIPYVTNIADARIIIGIRYELELRLLEGFFLDPYVFSKNLTPEFITIIRERKFPGVVINETFTRTYHTQSAGHLLGYIGKMTDTEWYGEDVDGDGKLKGDGDGYESNPNYSFGSFVGKTGVEQAFEEQLHGVDGYEKQEIAPNGAVVSILERVDPVPGNNVYLSIDIDMQKTAEDALIEHIDLINSEREDDKKIPGGSVVVIDPYTGEIFALASVPTFDPAKFTEQYEELSKDPNRPLFNRAVSGTYNPGSTFKPITAYAGLVAGRITAETEIEDTGIYRRYIDSGYAPRCWIYSQARVTHGFLNVVGAIRESCNVFFFTVGDDDTVGRYKLAEAAREFGFGDNTGIEIAERKGIVATPEAKLELFKAIDLASHPGMAYEDIPSSEKEGYWVSGDTVQVSIGQGISYYTPLQIANYCSTIANGGTLNNVTILHAIKSAGYEKTILEWQPTAKWQIKHPEFLYLIKDGMRQVVTRGTARTTATTIGLSDLSFHVSAKTGTTQSSTSSVDNGVFMCFAPSEDPQLAISVVIEKAGAGKNVIAVARTVLLDYFGTSIVGTDTVEGGV
ncbi:MAG: hypothetical protein LBO63_03745 [Oscillospiraceae bacterium]|jgi:penicillin-binding protein 2|nr:hypothetical protein [Oscillospiraceae bacterium]